MNSLEGCLICCDKSRRLHMVKSVVEAIHFYCQNPSENRSSCKEVHLTLSPCVYFAGKV